ncbi:MAG TPA: flagellar hook-basal body complex protein FliE [Phycisphaerales bacterium]|nr:flagellar hook-basal body complex protein FliE [Phycisphaerales bacterium]
MSDPIGLISGAGGAGHQAQPRSVARGPNAPNFGDVLRKSLSEVNEAQQEATRAVEDLATGQRNDVEGVILATQKADNAFRMLQALRNRVMDAYEEVKQMRV